MLALKLLLVPGFLALVSLAGRRWGPNVAGWLAGFPAVVGSILFVLALEHGAAFAASAATASLSAVVASATFSLAYSRACLRRPWTIASPLAIGAWALASIAVSLLPVSLPLALVMALAMLLAAPHLFPSVDALPLLANDFDRRELLLRMAVGAALTVVVSLLAARIGPARSGILSAFPVIGSVLTVFCQRSSGSAYVVILLRTMVRGLYAFTALCAALSILLPRYGISGGFLGASALAFATQAVLRHRSRVDAARRLKPDTALR